MLSQKALVEDTSLVCGTVTPISAFAFKMPCSFILFVVLFSEKGILHWV